MLIMEICQSVDPFTNSLRNCSTPGAYLSNGIFLPKDTSHLTIQQIT